MRIRVRSSGGASAVLSDVDEHATAAQLRSLCAARLGLNEHQKARYLTGYPPTEISFDDGRDGAAVKDIIADGDTIVVEADSTAAAAPRASSPKAPASKRARQSPPKAHNARAGRGSSSRAASALAKSDADPTLVTTVRSDLASQLVEAAAASSAAQLSGAEESLRALRRALKEERQKHGQVVTAHARLEAALARQYSITYSSDDKRRGDEEENGEAEGEFTVRFRLRPRTSAEETYGVLPREVMAEVVRSIHGDEQWRPNLRAYNMTLASPRVYWNLVRLYGPSVEDGLRTIAPELDWSFLDHRKRTARILPTS